ELTLPFDYWSLLGFDSPEDAVDKAVTFGITTAAGEQKEDKATIVGVQEKSLVDLGGANANDALMRSLSAIQSEGRPASAPEGYMAVIARVAEDTSSEDMDRIKSDLREEGYEAQTFQDAIGIFKQVVGAIIAVLNFFAVIALIAASAGVVNALLMQGRERTVVSGLMKAMERGS